MGNTPKMLLSQAVLGLIAVGMIWMSWVNWMGGEELDATFSLFMGFVLCTVLVSLRLIGYQHKWDPECFQLSEDSSQIVAWFPRYKVVSVFFMGTIVCLIPIFIGITGRDSTMLVIGIALILIPIFITFKILLGKYHRGSIALSPEYLTIRNWGSSVRIPWNEAVGIWVDRDHQSWLIYYVLLDDREESESLVKSQVQSSWLSKNHFTGRVYDPSVRVAEIRVAMTGVEQDLLLLALNHYIYHPNDRSELTGETALNRIRRSELTIPEQGESDQSSPEQGQ